MKELQKYYAEGSHVISTDVDRYGPFYATHEADAAFAEMRREHEDDLAASARQLCAYAAEIERLKAEHEEVIAGFHRRLYALQEEADSANHEFKNFHRLLCERFGYVHDERDWRRDQVSLIEHLASLRLQAELYEKLRGVSLADYPSAEVFDSYVDQLPASGEAPASRKGEYGQECNRTVCKRSPATWHNHGTNRYYCEHCGKLINANNRDIDPPLCSPASGEASAEVQESRTE